MRVLEWIAGDRVDAEAAADRPVIEAIAEDGHECIRVLPSSSEGDPARPVRETAGVRRLPWNPDQAAWYEAGEIDAICESHRGRGIDLIWARGRSAWRAGTRAAARLDAPLWIELGSIPEAAALGRVPRGVDLLLTVATIAEVEHLRPVLRDRLLSCPGGEPLIVPPAITVPHRDGNAGTAAGTGPPKIVVASPGRRPNAACIRMIGSLIERVHAMHATQFPRLESLDAPPGEAGTNEASRAGETTRRRGPVEVFLEDPLAERPPVRRLLDRLGAGAPTVGGTPADDASAAPDRIIRIPPLGRCRGAIADGDLLFAPQPLLRQRPAVVEAIASGALFASPPDPEIDAWLEGGGVELPARGGAAVRSAAIDAMLEVLADDGPRRALVTRARQGLATLLDPRTRVEAVKSAIARVAHPHQISFLDSTPSDLVSRPPN